MKIVANQSIALSVVYVRLETECASRRIPEGVRMLLSVRIPGVVEPLKGHALPLAKRTVEVRANGLESATGNGGSAW